MNTQGNPDSKIAFIVLAVGSYLALVLLSFRVWPQFSIVLLLLGLGGGIAWLATEGRRSLLNAQSTRAERHTFAGRIKTRLAECRAKEEQFRRESEAIRNSIRVLREDLERGSGADEAEKARAQVLIKEFEAEFNLRHAKVSFFTDCSERLEELLARHQLHQSITARKRELEQLRQTNFDDEALMEETRYHLEQDSIQLDTIVELSKDVAVSFKAEQAEELRARLEKLRVSLGNRPDQTAE